MDAMTSQNLELNHANYFGLLEKLEPLVIVDRDANHEELALKSFQEQWESHEQLIGQGLTHTVPVMLDYWNLPQIRFGMLMRTSNVGQLIKDCVVPALRWQSTVLWAIAAMKVAQGYPSMVLQATNHLVMLQKQLAPHVNTLGVITMLAQFIAEQSLEGITQKMQEQQYTVE